MTADGKTASDRKCWSDWLTEYISRLEVEIEGAGAESLNAQRQQAMLESNPRYADNSQHLVLVRGVVPSLLLNCLCCGRCV